MSNEVKAIAERIKELRDICEYTPQEAAQAASISVEQYLAFEEGNEDIPVSVLYALAEFYNVEMVTLLTGGDAHLRTYTLVRKGEGVKVKRHGEYDYTSLAYKFMSKKMEPLYVTAPVESDNDVIHTSSHAGQEFEYVLEGTLKLVMGGKELILNEGDCIYFDSTIPHGMRSIGDTEAKMLVIIIN